MYLFLALASFCSTQPSDDLRFLAPAVNLGELRSHVVREHRFEFVNDGTQPLEIQGIDPSCGCMVASLPRRRYQPGEKGVLTVNVKPSSQPQGAHTWFAKVRYRSGDREETAHVQIQATIRHEVAVSPGVLAWCGESGFSAEVTVTDLRGQPLKVKAVQFTSPIVRAAVTGSEKGVTRILLQSSAAIPAGRHDEMLNIYTDDPLYQQFQVPVTLTGQVRQAVSVTPERISHRFVMGEPVPSTLVRLRPSTDQPLAITRVIADDPAIICTWALGPLNGATLRIQVDAAKLGERGLQSAVRVHVSQPVEEVVIIPVQINR